MSVFQLKDGRWVCSYPRGKNTDKPESTRSYFGRSAADEDKARRLNEMLGLGTRKMANVTPTFSSLADKYMESSTARVRSWDKTLNRLYSRVLPILGTLMAHNITSERLDQYIYERSRSVSMATVRGELSVVRTILRWSVNRRYLTHNPMEGYPLPAPNYKVIQPPSKKEFEAILECASPHLQRAMLLSYHTGLRPGQEELLSLTWDTVDFHNRTINITSAHKGGLPQRIVPLNQVIYDSLMDWYNQDEKAGIRYIVTYRGKPIKEFQTAWKAAKKRARITRKLRLYDIRHKAISDMLAAGADLKSVSEIVGHSSPDITMRVYQHVNTAQKQDAVNLLGTDKVPNTI